MSKVSFRPPRRITRVERTPDAKAVVPGFDLLAPRGKPADHRPVSGSFLILDTPRLATTTSCVSLPVVEERPSPALKRLLFSTSMSNTYLGQTEEGEKVVVKVLPKADAASKYDPELELKITSMAQSHPNVVHLLSVDHRHNRETTALTFALANKGDLYEFLGEFKQDCLPLELARRCFRQVVSAVAHLHSLNIAWRDAKPENVLVSQHPHTGETNFLITDFGLSEHFLHGPPLSDQGTGTKQFSAPEVFPSRRRATHFNAMHADLWSLGILLHRILFGDIPAFQKSLTAKKLFSRLRSRKIALPAKCDPQARDLLRKILQPCPEERLAIDAVLAHPFLSTP